MSIDNLILIILVAVVLFYCYKKGKFPFRKRGKSNGKDSGVDTPKETAVSPNGIHYPAGMPYSAQGMQDPYLSYLQSLQGLQNLQGAQALSAQPNGIAPQGDYALQSITFCKIIPWTFRFDPLPFTDNGAKTVTADNAFTDDIPTIGLTINEEIDALNASGFTVTGLQAVSVPLDDSAVRLLLFITCSGAEYPTADH